MAKIINLPTMNDDRGCLSVVENITDFDIKRVYYIYNTDGKQRGGHRHKKTKQLLMSTSGSCNVFCENEKKETETFLLDSPSKCLLVEAKDWHTMQNFSKDCVLLVIASEYYDKNDYIDDRY
ncbi:FdtA/QdtA family cupin domain-containing protein [Sulfurimonas sp.]|uniref:sugar 3,4-ketoisomerase n=1 Tax=Sulfurimonas sp. TaxID=2022749 RepID=UPI002AB0AC5B|nr:FdtA/QdtA family cupin domain-containing protein [Sulfurimonas sp.]